MNNNTLKS